MDSDWEFEDEATWESHHQAIVDLAALVKELVGAWENQPFLSALGDPLGITARVVVLRQTEGLQAVLKLVDSGLGHMGVPFVRPACEELLWMKYLLSLARDDAAALIHLLNMHEAATSVARQQQFMGSKEMKGLGFPRGFVKAMEKEQTDTKEAIIRLGAKLRWPSADPPVALPSTWWLAQKVGLPKLYDFLYSASSRGVHFSASEVFRRCWGDPAAMLSFEDEGYVRYRSAFAMSWCMSLLIETISAVTSLIPEMSQERDDEWGSRLIEASRQIGAYGKVPIITAEEFNLHKTGWPIDAGAVRTAFGADQDNLPDTSPQGEPDL